MKAVCGLMVVLGLAGAVGAAVVVNDDFAGVNVDTGVWTVSGGGSVFTDSGFVNANGGGRIRSNGTATIPALNTGELVATFTNVGTGDWDTASMELGLYSTDGSQYVRVTQDGYGDWCNFRIKGSSGDEAHYQLRAGSWEIWGPELRWPSCDRTWKIVLTAGRVQLYVNDGIQADVTEGQDLAQLSWCFGGIVSIPTAPLAAGLQGDASGNFKADGIKLEVNLTPVTVGGQVEFDSFVGDKTTVGLKFTLTPSAGGPTITRPVFLQADGTFALDSIPPDNYTLTVKGKDTLTVVRTGVQISAGSATLTPAIVLKGADSNGDDRISFEDFSILQNNYGDSSAVANPLAAGAATGGCGALGVMLLTVLALGGLALRNGN